MALESAVNIVLPLIVRLIFTLWRIRTTETLFVTAMYLQLLGKVYKQPYKYWNTEN